MSSKINFVPSELESRHLKKFLEQIVLNGITGECSFCFNGSKFSVRLRGRGVFCPRPNCIDGQFVNAINNKVFSLASLADEINELRSLWRPVVQKTFLSSSSLLVGEIEELIAFSVSEEKINQMLHLVSPVVTTICPCWFMYVYFERRMH